MICYEFYMYKKGKLEFEIVIKSFFRPSLIIFIIFFLYLHFVLSNRGLFNIDDFLHWGAMVKDLIRNNELYPINKFVLVPPGTYPPFTTLLEGLFNKFLGGYNESSSLLALSSFMFSYFIQFLDCFEFKKEDLLKCLITFVTLVVLTLTVQLADQMWYRTFFYTCTYVDWVLAIVTAHAFYSLKHYHGKSYDFVNIVFSMVVLILTKQIGLALAILIFATFVVIVIVDKKINWKKIGKIIFFALLFVGTLFCMWQLFIGNVTDSNLIGTIFNVIFDALNSNGLSQAQTDILHNYLVALTTKPLIMHPIHLSYIAIVTIVAILLFLFGYFHNDKKMVITGIFYLLGAIGYAFAMMLFYVFVLSSSEGTGLVMYGRYLQTYTYASLLLVFWHALNEFCDLKKLCVIMILSFLFIEPLSVESLIYDPDYQKFRSKEMSEIQPWIDDEYDFQPLIVLNSTDMAYKTLLKYSFDVKSKNITFYQPLKDLDDFKATLDKNEMIFIADYDMKFYDEYWSKLTSDPVYNNTLYKIKKDGEDYHFEMIYTWDE